MLSFTQIESPPATPICSTQGSHQRTLNEFFVPSVHAKESVTSVQEHAKSPAGKHYWYTLI